VKQLAQTLQKEFTMKTLTKSLVACTMLLVSVTGCEAPAQLQGILDMILGIIGGGTQ
jgi:hypothetical protein